MKKNIVRSVTIRPKVTVLSVLAHLEYKPWFALAEYVDNSIQSFDESKDKILKVDGQDTKLQVDIDLDTGAKKITIRDNAGGIARKDYKRAFRPAELPPNKTGLSEFGMGMKSASCWFAPVWVVRTTALGEPIERIIKFDIEKIVNDQIEELKVVEKKAKSESHYTVIELQDVRSMPVKRTAGKIREHLADIYRDFFREDKLNLTFAGEALLYKEPPVLNAPFFTTKFEPKNNKKIVWRKDIDFDFGSDLKVVGFAALRKTMSSSYAGFSLFRRGRVIEGSADNKYRPIELSDGPGSILSKRLFGELHLVGFDVSHTKDGFRWDQDDEESFLDLLKEHLQAGDMPLLTQGRRYRERASQVIGKKASAEAVESTARAIGASSEIVSKIRAKGISTKPTPTRLKASTNEQEATAHFEVDGKSWTVKLELSRDASVKDLITMSERTNNKKNTIGVRVGLESKFIRNMVKDNEQLELVMRLLAGIGLAEHLARQSGVKKASTVRININELLSDALAFGD